MCHRYVLPKDAAVRTFAESPGPRDLAIPSVRGRMIPPTVRDSSFAEDGESRQLVSFADVRLHSTYIVSFVKPLALSEYLGRCMDALLACLIGPSILLSLRGIWHCRLRKVLGLSNYFGAKLSETKIGAKQFKPHFRRSLLSEVGTERDFELAKNRVHVTTAGGRQEIY